MSAPEWRRRCRMPALNADGVDLDAPWGITALDVDVDVDVDADVDAYAHARGDARRRIAVHCRKCAGSWFAQYRLCFDITPPPRSWAHPAGIPNAGIMRWCCIGIVLYNDGIPDRG